MDATARQSFELAFVIAWIGGALCFFVRMAIVQYEFASRLGRRIYDPFSPPLIFRFLSPGASWRTIFPTLVRQSDPSLEALRLKIKSRFLQMGAWIFLFPIPFVVVLALLPPVGKW